LRNQDWSLVLFTTLAQLSVGMILWFTLAGYFFSDLGVFMEPGPATRYPVLLALVLIGVATVTSFLHLGNPSNAPNALNNLSGSWLSREILALGVYALSLIIVLILGWNTGGTEHLKYFMALSSVTGLTLLWMMIRIYVVPTIPAWYSWHTPLSFALTALCLGLLALLVFHHAGAAKGDDEVIKQSMGLLMLILFVETASGFIHQIKLEKMSTGIDELVFNQGPFYRFFLVRMGLLFIAFMAIFILTLKPDLLLAYGNNAALYPLFVLIVVQELLGRLLFYSSYFRIGV
jgi:anaerobic dimethyl sulfoxide reductase subunit C (anchor subunit)